MMDKLMDALRAAEAALETAYAQASPDVPFMLLNALEKVRAALASAPAEDAHHSAAPLIAEVADLRGALRDLIEATRAEGALGLAISRARRLVRGT